MRKMFMLGLLAGVVFFSSAQTVQAQNMTLCFQTSQWPDTFRLILEPVGDGVFQVAGQDFDPVAGQTFAVDGTAVPVDGGGTYKVGLTTFSHTHWNVQYSVEMIVSAVTGAGTGRTFNNDNSEVENGTVSLVSCAGFDSLKLTGDRPDLATSKRRP